MIATKQNERSLVLCYGVETIFLTLCPERLNLQLLSVKKTSS